MSKRTFQPFFAVALKARLPSAYAYPCRPLILSTTPRWGAQALGL